MADARLVGSGEWMTREVPSLKWLWNRSWYSCSYPIKYEPVKVTVDTSFISTGVITMKVQNSARPDRPEKTA